MAKRIKAAGLSILLTLGLASCSEASEPTFDATSETAFQASVERIKEKLSQSERERLAQAIMRLGMADVADAMQTGGFAALAQMPATPEALLAKIGKQINGRTATEVLAMADDVAAQRLQRQLAALDEQIATLTSKVDKALGQAREAEATLAQFDISGARYYWTDGAIGSEPTVAFRITNKSNIAIRRAFFHGLVETPGRAVPWIDDGFNYQFRGGLEPGETQNLKLAPNRFSDWGYDALKERNDLVLTLTLSDIEDAQGEKLRSVSLEEVAAMQERLAALRQQRIQIKPASSN